MVERHITNMADNIRKKVVGSSLYGKQIDVNDIDSMIVVAYYLGREEQRRENEIIYRKRRRINESVN